MTAFVPARNVLDPSIFVSPFTRDSIGQSYHGIRGAAAASGAYAAANRIYYYSFRLSKPYSLARWWWHNGATVGTNYVQVGIYRQDFTLCCASPRTLSAGTANYVQYSDPGIHGTNLTAAADNSNADTYTTASVTLKAGVLYLLAVENSHGSSAPAVSSIDSATGGYPTFTSRSTTQFNAAANRVSIWSTVPTTDWTGTLRIQMGASSGVTGAIWSLNAFFSVDVAATDGVVQQQVGTGSDTTPLSTLGAFGNAHNATFGAFGQAANAAGAPESASYIELSDTATTAPVQALQCDFNPANDTTVSETITSAAWGACAVELKALLAPIALPPMTGWLAIHCNGTTATFFRSAAASQSQPFSYIQSSATLGLPPTGTPAAGTGIIHSFGFTSRTLPAAP